MQTDETTPDIVGPTILGVVASVLAVVCKRMQQVPTILVPAVHRGKDTTPKTLETMCHACAWPQQCWKSCANGSNIVALRFSDHGTKEMLGVMGSNIWPPSNFALQRPITCNRVCKRTQHVTSNNRELRNDDGDSNENGKKAIGLHISKTTTSARASRFFVHFSAVVARLQRETA